MKKVSCFLLHASGCLLFVCSTILANVNSGCDISFGTRQNTSVAFGPVWSALVDFDQNEQADVISLDEEGVPTLLLNGGSDNSQAVVSEYIRGFYHTRAMAVGYFDGDYVNGEFVVNPYPDIVVATTDGAVFLLTSDPYGYFSLRGTPVLQGYYAALATTDFNHDGMSDVMAIDSVGGGYTLLSQGDGNWGELVASPYTSAVYGEDEYPRGAAVGNFDGDMVEGSFQVNGTSDLAVITDHGRLFLYTTDQYGYFSVRETYTGLSFAVVRTVDFNADNRSDLLMMDEFGLVHLLQRNANGDFDVPRLLMNDAAYTVIGGSDINGDGISDVALTMGQDAHFAWLPGDFSCASVNANE